MGASVTPTAGAHGGFPSSLTLLFLHATAWGLRRTSIPSPWPVLLVLPSVYVKTLGLHTKLIATLYQHFRVRLTPAAYRILCLRFARLVRRLSATPPRTQDSLRVGG